MTNKCFIKIDLFLVFVFIICACSARVNETENQAAIPLSQNVQVSATSQSQGDISAKNECIETYIPGIDYFPKKTTVRYATGFKVEYHDAYKIVSVNPTSSNLAAQRYVLVQCGAPGPQGFTKDEIFTIPVKSVIAMSTTYLPFIENLGTLDRLIAVDEPTYINNPTVNQMLKEDRITTVGSGAAVNIEKVLNLAPDLILAYDSGVPDYDALPKLLEAHIKTAVVGEHAESDPLGRAEWEKFIALFFNREGEAEKDFSETENKYLALKKVTADVEKRPSVLLNSEFQGTWYVAGGKSYMARLLADAGADYLWSDDPSANSVPLNFESVFEKAHAADYWIPAGFWLSKADALKEDERYSKFTAYTDGQIYNNNARSNAYGGNDFYESGTSHPDVILADLIHIFHPDLLPDHQLYYFRNIGK